MKKGDFTYFEQNLPVDVMNIINKKIQDDWIITRRLQRKKNRRQNRLQKQINKDIIMKIFYDYLSYAKSFLKDKAERDYYILDLYCDDKIVFELRKKFYLEYCEIHPEIKKTKLQKELILFGKI